MALPSRPSFSSFKTTASSSQSSLRRGHFIYDVLSTNNIRLFKLDLNGEDEPLSGQLLTTYFHWDVTEGGSYQYWKNYMREDTDIVMQKLSGEEGYDTFSYTW